MWWEDQPERLWSAWYPANPFELFPHDPTSVDRRATKADKPVFDFLIAMTQPRIIIEVGSWLGDSAIAMLNITPKETIIICIDTWLGGVENWSPKHRKKIHYDALNIVHGRPTFYNTFMCNIIEAGHDRRVIPISQTSRNASILLADRKLLEITQTRWHDVWR
jgi:hypothetical protein